jgi:hypothetical protein
MSDLPEKRVVNMDEIARLAKMASESGLVEKSAGAAGVKMATAASLGLSPLAGLLHIHSVKGKPMISSRMLLGLINNATNVKYRWVEPPTDDSATIQISRRESPAHPWEDCPPTTFTMAMAKKARLGGNGSAWDTHPSMMLAWRATSTAVALYCPEIAMDIPVDDGDYADIVAPEPVRATVGEPETKPQAAEFAVTVDPMGDDEPVYSGEVVSEGNDTSEPEPVADDQTAKPITAKQRARLWAIAKQSLGDDANEVVKRLVMWLTKQESTSDIPVSAYDVIVTLVETWPEAEPELLEYEQREGVSE